MDSRLHRVAWLVICAVVLGIAAWLRFSQPGIRPIHADESVQGWKVGQLLDGRGYRCDPADHHGPTLYYLMAPIAWMRGERTLGDLRIETLRLLPALVGLATVAAMLGSFSLLGRGAALGGALFAAVSPLLVYYSRDFIQEPMVVLFGFAAVVLLWAALASGRRRWFAAGGIAVGLLVATKESWPATVLAGLAGAVAAAVPDRGLSGMCVGLRNRLPGIGIAVVFALLTAVLFYSSWFTNPGGVGDAVHGLLAAAGRTSDTVHDKPWHYYSAMLLGSSVAGRWWMESAILGFAILALPGAWRRKDDHSAAAAVTRFFLVFTLVQAVFFSLVPYKTPWIACGFWHGAIVLAGLGAARLMGPRRSHVIRGLAVVAVMLSSWQLLVQAQRAALSLRWCTRNPYAYVETSPDAMRLPQRLRSIAAVMPAGTSMTIKVAVDDYWPLPWLLREFPNVGYWDRPPDDPAADVAVYSSEVLAGLDPAFLDGKATEFIGLRDGVVLVLALDQAVWDAALDASAD